MSIAVSLEWDYCTDGVEIHDYGGGQPRAGIAINRTGRWVRPKSLAVRKRRLELRDLSDATVLKFVGANDDQALVDFLSDHGIIGSPMETGVSALPLDTIKSKRDGLRLLLETRSPERVFSELELPAVMVVLRRKGGGRTTMSLKPKSLYGFMCIEAALIITGDSRITSCDNCGVLFLVGPSSRKRAGSIYCSPRCRVAAHRTRLHFKTQRGI
jgi:hypothetical protein